MFAIMECNKAVGAVKDAGRDRLDMEYINSLPQPLWDRDWPVYDIDVETGLYRIDVCGMLDIRHIDGCIFMKDNTGKKHFVSDFELDPTLWEERELPAKYLNAGEGL